jgi:hypothetical protein
MILANHRSQYSMDCCQSWQGEPMDIIIPRNRHADQQVSAFPYIVNHKKIIFSVKSSAIIHHQFWEESTNKKGKPILSINEIEFLVFFQKNGFGRLFRDGKLFVARVVNGRIQKISAGDVVSFLNIFVETLPDQISASFCRDDLKLLLIENSKLYSIARLKWLNLLQIDGESHD